MTYARTHLRGRVLSHDCHGWDRQPHNPTIIIMAAAQAPRNFHASRSYIRRKVSGDPSALMLRSLVCGRPPTSCEKQTKRISTIVLRIVNRIDFRKYERSLDCQPRATVCRPSPLRHVTWNPTVTSLPYSREPRTAQADVTQASFTTQQNDVHLTPVVAT